MGTNPLNPVVAIDWNTPDQYVGGELNPLADPAAQFASALAGVTPSPTGGLQPGGIPLAAISRTLFTANLLPATSSNYTFQTGATTTYADIDSTLLASDVALTGRPLYVAFQMVVQPGSASDFGVTLGLNGSPAVGLGRIGYCAGGVATPVSISGSAIITPPFPGTQTPGPARVSLMGATGTTAATTIYRDNLTGVHFLVAEV